MTLTPMSSEPIDKQRPSPEWIEDVRTRFPAEPEMDRVLTRKLRNRHQAFAWPTQEEITAGLKSLLEAELGERLHGITDVRGLSGGASKIQYYFELAWTQQDGSQTRTPMVLRMDPAASIQETSRKREFELLKAFQGVVPVPRAYWLDAEGEHLPYPAMITGFVSGVTKPSAGGQQVSGLQASLGPEFRDQLGTQFIEHLAAIHNHDVDDPELRSFDRPGIPKDVIRGHINAWERVWEEDSDIDVPLVRLGFAWLHENVPDVDRLSVVHCDYRTGNYLFTEDDLRISAILDWEGGHIGDRHEDLAYTVNRMFGSFDENGGFLISGLMTEDDFLSSYETVSGLAVHADSFRYWKVFNCVKTLVITLATAYRITHGKQTHQDVLVAWLVGTEGLLLGELRATLKEVL